MKSILIITFFIYSTLAIAQPINLLKCQNANTFIDIRYIPNANLLDVTVDDEDGKSKNYTKELTEVEFNMIKEGNWNIELQDAWRQQKLLMNISGNGGFYVSSYGAVMFECTHIDFIE